mmetsp:Transcript_18697/g.24679  ORF Transcript_18697/g.24679 Transcript_18697/m.24679 type:complete len:239 (-) Transcript_18697:376-1092(-)
MTQQSVIEVVISGSVMNHMKKKSRRNQDGIIFLVLLLCSCLSKSSNAYRFLKPSMNLKPTIVGEVTRQNFISGILSTVAGIPLVLTIAFASTADKSIGLSVDTIREIIEQDFKEGKYFVTGKLTESIYKDDCLFIDPTTRVNSLEKYVKACEVLFDPENSQVDLLSLEIVDETHLFAEWRLGGYLKFPWNPYVPPFTGTTLYTLDNSGLISKHEETWSISALDAVKYTVQPTKGPSVI